METGVVTRNLNLYQINGLIKQITQEPIVDEETGEILNDRYDELAQLEMSKEEIVKHVTLSYKDLDGEIDKVKKELQRIADIKNKLEKLKERAKCYLQDNLEPGKNFKSIEYEIKWTNSEAIEVDEIFLNMDEVEKVYPELIRVKKELDKVKAKAMAKAGGILPEGISLKKRTNLNIK